MYLVTNLGRGTRIGEIALFLDGEANGMGEPVRPTS